MSPRLCRRRPQSQGFPRVSGDEPEARGVDWPPVSFPRVSGDEPWNQLADAIPGALSPRERGWTVADLVGTTHPTVFPA